MLFRQLFDPLFMDYAVPGNKQCGVCPSDLPEDLQKYCRQMSESPQGQVPPDVHRIEFAK